MDGLKGLSNNKILFGRQVCRLGGRQAGGWAKQRERHGVQGTVRDRSGSREDWGGRDWLRHRHGTGDCRWYGRGEGGKFVWNLACNGTDGLSRAGQTRRVRRGVMLCSVSERKTFTRIPVVRWLLNLIVYAFNAYCLGLSEKNYGNGVSEMFYKALFRSVLSSVNLHQLQYII